MKKHVASFQLSTKQREVVIVMPESAEVLGLSDSGFGPRVDVLVSKPEPWVEWRFRWNDGEGVENLKSENYVGSARVGPGETRWHLFFVE